MKESECGTIQFLWMGFVNSTKNMWNTFYIIISFCASNIFHYSMYDSDSKGGFTAVF